MNDRTDRPTQIERQGAPDCLAEMAIEWMERPIGRLSDATRAEAVDEICLLISQMRRPGRHGTEIEQLRWIERVSLRLCRELGSMTGYQGAVQLEVQRRVVASLLRYHEWREQVAPIVPRSIATGPSDGGEIHA